MNDLEFRAINGGPDLRFNQSLDWFLNSKHYTANVPLNFLFVNEANQLETHRIPWLRGRDISFSQGTYTRGDKVVLYYANESVLNFKNAEHESVVEFEVEFIKSCIEHFNIPLCDIILIGNVYQRNNCFSRLADKVGLDKEQVILIDYYELQTFFFHRVLGCDFNKSFNPAAPKYLRYQFGKVSKLVRIIAMYELWQQQILSNAVTGCLIDPKDIEGLAEEVSIEFQQWYKQDVSKQQVSDMLMQYHGSIDNARYFYFKRTNALKQQLEVINHCPGYPYDHIKIFTDTKVSLVPETFFYNNQSSFLTEKIFKTIFNHHPFTLLGTPGLLSILRSRGYKTFGSVCNEMYDFCNNDRKRLKMVIDATKELINSKNHKEISDVTDYNFKQLEKNSIGTIGYLNQSITNVFN